MTDLEKGVFTHPWKVWDVEDWQGILTICGTVKSGKSRIAREYAVRGIEDGALVVYLSSEHDEANLLAGIEARVLSRKKVPSGEIRGRIITRSCDAPRRMLDYLISFSQQADLIILDQHAFGPGLLTEMFRAMKSGTETWKTAYIMVAAAKMTNERYPQVRSDKIGQLSDVIVGVTSQKGSFPIEEDFTEEEKVRAVEMSMHGVQSISVWLLKDRYLHTKAGMGIQLDPTTLERMNRNLLF